MGVGWACVIAQPAGLTLAQAQRAAAANIEVSLARRSLAAARADVLAADHAPAPVLSAKASSIDLQNGPGPGNVLRDKRIDKSIGIDWTLERGDKRGLRTRAAQFNADAARADLQETMVQQQMAASAAWYDLMAAQERVTLVDAIQKSGAQLAVNAQRRLSAGDLSRQDTMRVEIEAERARADLQSALADRVRAALALSQATGVRQPDIVATGSWPEVIASPPGSAPAPERRAEVRAAGQRVLAAQAAVDSALALRKSDFTVGASVDHFPGTSTRQVELRVQVPLTGGWAYGFEGEIGRALAQLELAQDQLEKTRRAVAADLQRLQGDLAASTARATSYEREIVPRARQVAEMAEFAYGRGSMSLADLVDARRTLRNVLLEGVAARADHGRALAAWHLRSSEPEQVQD